MSNQKISKKDLDNIVELLDKASNDVGNIGTDASSYLTYPETIEDFMLYLSSSCWQQN